MKIRLMGSEFFCADEKDRQTDVYDEANSLFSQFWKSP